eukprot:Pgem_evm1s5257
MAFYTLLICVSLAISANAQTKYTYKQGKCELKNGDDAKPFVDYYIIPNLSYSKCKKECIADEECLAFEYNPPVKEEEVVITVTSTTSLIPTLPPARPVRPPVSNSPCYNNHLSQCGGSVEYLGQTCCPAGHHCKFQNEYWSDCQKGSAPTSPTARPKPTDSADSDSCGNLNDRCDGISGSSTCCKGSL